MLIYLIGSLALMNRMIHPSRKTYAVALGRGWPTSPADMGLESTEQTFRFRDDSTSPGWIITGEKPDGPLIILTHGWSNSRYGALMKAGRLTQWASRVVVYDMRGHGDQTAKICQLGATEPQDLIDLMDQVQQTPDEPIVLVGSSMGAGISLEAAVRDQPDQLTSDSSPKNRVVGVMLDGPYRFAMQPVARHLQNGRIPAEPFCTLAHLWLRLRLGWFSTYDRAAQAAQLACPLLVIHGTDDPICPIESARQIAQAAPQHTFVAIQDGLHGQLPLVDKEAYHNAIDQWIGLLSDKI